MISKVLLDIDGVLNKFMPAALRFVGCDVPLDDSCFKPEWGWDGMYLAVQHYLGSPLSAEDFWSSLDRKFWSTVPLSDEAEWIIDRAAALVGQKNVCLLTSPPRDPDAAAGKIEWIQRNLPKWLHRQFLIGPRKHFCAHPDHVLVDDADHNCREFIEHGGRTILVPRPWNSNHELNTAAWINERFLAFERINGHAS